MLVRLGKDAWLCCDECPHTVMVKPRDFAERHGLDMLTPLDAELQYRIKSTYETFERIARESELSAVAEMGTPRQQT